MCLSLPGGSAQDFCFFLTFWNISRAVDRGGGGEGKHHYDLYPKPTNGSLIKVKSLNLITAADDIRAIDDVGKRKNDWGAEIGGCRPQWVGIRWLDTRVDRGPIQGDNLLIISWLFVEFWDLFVIIWFLSNGFLQWFKWSFRCLNWCHELYTLVRWYLNVRHVTSCQALSTGVNQQNDKSKTIFTLNFLLCQKKINRYSKINNFTCGYKPLFFLRN